MLLPSSWAGSRRNLQQPVFQGATHAIFPEANGSGERNMAWRTDMIPGFRFLANPKHRASGLLLPPACRTSTLEGASLLRRGPGRRAVAADPVRHLASSSMGTWFFDALHHTTWVLILALVYGIILYTSRDMRSSRFVESHRTVLAEISILEDVDWSPPGDEYPCPSLGQDSCSSQLPLRKSARCGGRVC
jgi:hypothetical protein